MRLPLKDVVIKSNIDCTEYRLSRLALYVIVIYMVQLHGCYQGYIDLQQLNRPCCYVGWSLDERLKHGYKATYIIAQLLITFFLLNDGRRVNDTTVKWSYGVPTKKKKKKINCY